MVVDIQTQGPCAFAGALSSDSFLLFFLPGILEWVGKFSVERSQPHFTQVDAEDVVMGLLLIKGKDSCTEEPGCIRSQERFFLTNSPVESSIVINKKKACDFFSL